MKKVLHLDSGKSWRGGQNQVYQLLKHFKGPYENHLAMDRSSQYIEKFREIQKDRLQLIIFNGLGFFWSFYRMWRYCKEHEIDLVHAHCSKGHNMGLMLKLLIPKLKFIVHRRVDILPIKTPLSMYKYRTSKVDRYIILSDMIGDYMTRTGVAKDKMVKIVSCAQPSPCYRAESALIRKKLFGLEETNDLLVLGYCGALTPEKGLRELLRVCKRLKDKGLKFKLFAAGRGVMQNQVEKLIVNLGLQHDVRLMGHIDDTDRYLAALDIFIFPSLHEGLGSTLLQAGTQRCFVIASEVGGIPEIIIDQKTGILVPGGDLDALEKNILYYHEHREEWPRLKDGLETLVKTKYSVEQMCASTSALYDEILV